MKELYLFILLMLLPISVMLFWKEDPDIKNHKYHKAACKKLPHKMKKVGYKEALQRIDSKQLYADDATLLAKDGSLTLVTKRYFLIDGTALYLSEFEDYVKMKKFIDGLFKQKGELR